MKRYAFLDMDGVINSSATHSNYRLFPNGLYPKWEDFKEAYPKTELSKGDYSIISLECVLQLSRLHMKGNVDFILISSWISNRDSVDTYKQVNQAFQFLTGTDNDFFVGQTASGVGGHGRESEVFDYIKDNLEPEDRFVVIDDSGDRHFKELMPFTVAPSGRKGFTLDDYIYACRILGMDNSEDDSWLDWDATHHFVVPEGWKQPNFENFYKKYIQKV